MKTDDRGSIFDILHTLYVPKISIGPTSDFRLASKMIWPQMEDYKQ